MLTREGSWPIIRPVKGIAGAVEVTQYNGRASSLIIHPCNKIEPCPVANVESPDAVLRYDGIQIMPYTTAHTFRGFMYGLTCDTNPIHCLANVIYSLWIPELQTLIVVHSFGLPWLIMPGGIKAHLHVPPSLCRSRASWSYYNGFLYNVGGKKPSGHRSHLVWSVDLKKYVNLCLQYGNHLESATQNYLINLKEKLLESFPETFDTLWPTNQFNLKWQSHFRRGLCPPQIIKRMWRIHPSLIHAVTEPAVRFIDHGRIMMVAGGLVSRESRTSSVEFFNVKSDGLLTPFNYIPQTFCPDNTAN